MSSSLWPCEPQHARPPCPSPTPRVHPNPCPLSRWCHPTISSSVVPFSSCPQSFPASGSFPMSQLFASGGQNIGVSASTSVLYNTLFLERKGQNKKSGLKMTFLSRRPVVILAKFNLAYFAKFKWKSILGLEKYFKNETRWVPFWDHLANIYWATVCLVVKK